MKDADRNKKLTTGLAADFLANREYSQQKSITSSQKVTARLQAGVSASQFDEPDINQPK